MGLNETLTTKPRKREREHTLNLSLREHHIGFFVPPDMVLDGSCLELKFGALIYGTVIGDIWCESGSVIIAAQGRVCGNIEADRIYIEGEVASPKGSKSTLTGRLLLAASANSKVNANVRSRAFAIHRAKIWGQIEPIEDSI
jgi:cytoskeletal protein CcmA (bactofilin family)